MQIKFLCGSCQARLKIEYEHAGEKIECPECRSGIRVPDQEIASGVVIGGFEIKGLIGKGGMGEVYLARQVSMDRDIALKILPAHLTRDKSLVERFLKEVRNSAQLDHPNIVTAYAAGEDDGIYYMAMTYIRGENLDAILQRGPMDEHETLELCRKIAGALRTAWNEHGMIHRDIKPENIIVDQKGVPKILDMGLSKSMHDSAQTATNPDTIMGSPNYMSPEQIESSDNVDFRADMYSMGTSMYHMLTGTIPFYGGSYINTLKRQSNEQLPDPRTINPHISDACVSFMERLLAKHPKHRFASWEELIEALDLVSKGHAVDQERLQTGRSVLERDGRAPMVNEDTENLFDDKKITSTAKKKSPLPTIIGVLIAVIAFVGVVAYLLAPGDSKNNDLTDLPSNFDPTASTTSTDDENPAQPAPPNPKKKKNEKIAEAFAQAILFTQANPAEYDEAIAKFTDIGMRASGTDYAIRATEQIDRISRKKDEAIQNTIAKIRSEVITLKDDNKLDEAATLVREYTGPLASETQSARKQIYDRILQEQAQLKSAREREIQLARVAAAQVGNKIVDHLLDNDVGAASALLEQAYADMATVTEPEVLQTVKQLIEEISNIPETVMDQYRKLIGREVEVYLKSKPPQRLRITELNTNNTVTAIKDIRQDNILKGYTTLRFSYEQLSTREILNRLDGSDPTMSLLRGMIYLESSSISNARKAFEECGTPLGALLKHRLDIRLGLSEDRAPLRQPSLENVSGTSRQRPPSRPGVNKGPRPQREFTDPNGPNRPFNDNRN